MALNNLDFPFQAERPYPFLLETTGSPLLFIHIPKTGGTSIRRGLKFPPTRKNTKLSKHYTAGVIKDHLPAKLWDEAYKFAFVRNPHERLYSHYQFRLRKNKVQLNFGSEVDFPTWVKAVLPLVEPNNLQAQHQWICDEDGQIMVDFIGKFETFEADFQQLCQQLELPPIILPHYNKSTQKGEYLLAYDNESWEIATHFYQEDLRLFNYASTPPIDKPPI